MRIASNKIADVQRFFRDELKGTYPNEEIEQFIVFCFEEFLNIQKHEISAKSNSTISESDLLKFNFAIKDLKKHKPIQYILGKADFYGLKFNVNEHVLIPRPETEELVDLIIKDCKSSKLKVKSSILDIGTGSGCISVALKKNIPSALISGLDISEKALEIANKNAETNNTEINFIQCDILTSSPNPFITLSLDIIVSNPPYVCFSEKEQMKKNILDYEPHLALFVGNNNPLLFYNKIADFAIIHLKPNGKLYFEINPVYAQQTMQMLEQKGFKNVILIKDLNDKNRILRCSISA